MLTQVNTPKEKAPKKSLLEKVATGMDLALGAATLASQGKDLFSMKKKNVLKSAYDSIKNPFEDMA